MFFARANADLGEGDGYSDVDVTLFELQDSGTGTEFVASEEVDRMVGWRSMDQCAERLVVREEAEDVELDLGGKAIDRS